jgi:hypothetical protein
MKKTTVLKHFGTHTEVARALTDAGYPICRSAVSQWPDVIPELRARQIEEITRGRLRPGSYRARP